MVNEANLNCRLTLSIAFSCFIGVLLSMYALNVEINAEEDENYEALCDINEHISCTKVFTSKYGRGFGIIGEIFGENSVLNQPNSFGGIFFYAIIGILAFINNVRLSKIQVYLCIVSNLMSLYLAYLLYFVLEDFCVVCVSTYVVNFVNLILSIKRFNYLSENQNYVEVKKSKKSVKKD